MNRTAARLAALVAGPVLALGLASTAHAQVIGNASTDANSAGTHVLAVRCNGQIGAVLTGSTDDWCPRTASFEVAVDPGFDTVCAGWTSAGDVQRTTFTGNATAEVWYAYNGLVKGRCMAVPDGFVPAGGVNPGARPTSTTTKPAPAARPADGPTQGIGTAIHAEPKHHGHKGNRHHGKRHGHRHDVVSLAR